MAYNKSGNGNGCGRTRNWATILYPESAPDDWQDILTNLHVRAACSPLHDSDLDAKGQLKKPHWHLIVCFDSVKTYEQASAVFQQIGGVGCVKISDVHAYCRYLCHQDNPEKHQYDIKDITTFAGFDVYDYVVSKSDQAEMLGDITEYIAANHITSFIDFMRWAKREQPEWFRLITACKTFLVWKLIESEGYKAGKKEKK